MTTEEDVSRPPRPTYQAQVNQDRENVPNTIYIKSAFSLETCLTALLIVQYRPPSLNP